MAPLVNPVCNTVASIEHSYAALFRLVVPQVIVLVTALVVLAVDLVVMRAKSLQARFAVGAAIASLGCAGAIFRLIAAPVQGMYLFDGVLITGPTVQLIQMVLLGLTILVVLLSIESKFTAHVGEFLALVLLATTSMMFLVSTMNILMIFVSLEMLSLSLYILAAFDKGKARSSEAALKYFLFGGTSAAFLLFGFSLLYGLAHSTSLREIAGTFGPSLDPLLVVAIVMVVLGFGFKVAAVPFHFWAPDVYEGAPAPSASLIASISKVASFIVFNNVLWFGFFGLVGLGAWEHYLPDWVPVVALVSALSMVLGNLGAIMQTSVRRLLAYSAIAHSGYVLVSLLSPGHFAAMFYYIVTYALTLIGAFGVVAIVEAETGGDRFSNFVGLSRRAPFLSFCMLIFMLSLAGIPPLAGFFGKFYIFASALNASFSLLWLVVLAIAMSAVSLYYYLKVLKQIYVVKAPSEDEPVIKTPVVSQVVIGLIALGVVLLGCAPNIFLAWLQRAASGDWITICR